MLKIQLVKEKKSCTVAVPNSDPCIHKEVRAKLSVDVNKNLVLSNELMKVEFHCERFRKLTFQALALHQSEDEGLTFMLTKG